MPSLVLALLIAASAAASLASPAAAQSATPSVESDANSRTLVVFAAASLKGALDEIAEAFNAQMQTEVKISYAGSSQLARQIERGAPADLFISADRDWMDYLQGENRIQRGSRADLLANRLVLIGPKGAKPIEIAPGFDVAGALGDGRLAMALVEAVPAGKYGKAALETLKVWNSIEHKLAQGDSVRAALAYVSRGEAPLGIVYATDAMAEPDVSVVGVFPKDSHPPIRYPAALTARAHSQAATFLDFIQSEAVARIFEEHGFIVLR